MKRKKRHLIYDLFFLAVSIAFAVYISKTGVAHDFILSFGDRKWLGIIVAGFFFTSMLTTPPAIVLLAQFAQTTPLSTLALLGGLGAMLGDYMIFKFVRDRIADDFDYLLSFGKTKRLTKIFKTKLFHFFVPFLGAIIIATPFPDEVGIAMLGLSRVKTNFFLAISFLMNGIGIYMIGLLAGSLG